MSCRCWQCQITIVSMMDRPQISPGPQSTSIHWTKWSTPIFFYNNLRWPRPQPPADQPFWSSTIGTINISTTVDHHHHHKDKHKIDRFHRPPYPSPASHIEWGLVTVDKKCNVGVDNLIVPVLSQSDTFVLSCLVLQPVLHRGERCITIS